MKGMLHHLRLSRAFWMTAILLAGSFIMLGCGRDRAAGKVADAPDTPAGEEATGTPVELPPSLTTAALPPQATETATVPPPTETAVPPPTPTEAPILPPVCDVPTSEDLVDYWREDLGCAQAGAVTLWLAEEEFEGGRMFWREDDGRIYVLSDDDSWEVYDDTWSEGDPEYSCGVEQSPPTPLRGFGKVWCTYPEVQSRLGDAITFEYGRDGVIQVFEHGFMIQPPFGVYSIHENGSWR